MGVVKASRSLSFLRDKRVLLHREAIKVQISELLGCKKFSKKNSLPFPKQDRYVAVSIVTEGRSSLLFVQRYWGSCSWRGFRWKLWTSRVSSLFPPLWFYFLSDIVVCFSFCILGFFSLCIIVFCKLNWIPNTMTFPSFYEKFVFFNSVLTHSNAHSKMWVTKKLFTILTKMDILYN